jgi:hypothetical protein
VAALHDALLVGGTLRGARCVLRAFVVFRQSVTGCGLVVDARWALGRHGGECKGHRHGGKSALLAS